MIPSEKLKNLLRQMVDGSVVAPTSLYGELSEAEKLMQSYGGRMFEVISKAGEHGLTVEKILEFYHVD